MFEVLFVLDMTVPVMKVRLMDDCSPEYHRQTVWLLNSIGIDVREDAAIVCEVVVRTPPCTWLLGRHCCGKLEVGGTSR